MRGLDFMVGRLPRFNWSSQHEQVSLLRSLLARWRAERIRQRSDRELEAVIGSDPRMRSDFLAAAAYAEWHD